MSKKSGPTNCNGSGFNVNDLLNACIWRGNLRRSTRVAVSYFVTDEAIAYDEEVAR